LDDEARSWSAQGLLGNVFEDNALFDCIARRPSPFDVAVHPQRKGKKACDSRIGMGVPKEGVI
jgi:hypothetical protein